jgi:hypothetical protein
MFCHAMHPYLLSRLQLPTIICPILPDINEQVILEFANDYASLTANIQLGAY